MPAKKHIAIYTDLSPSIGSGHFQRMCTLALELSKLNNYKISFVCRNSCFHNDDIKKIYVKNIPPDVDLIIRDMRDSSEKEMDSLQKNAPVLAIDDCGNGRRKAKWRLDLLPNLINAQTKPFYPQIFLYGLNFTESLKEAYVKSFSYKFDIAVYASRNPDKDIEAFIRRSIPRSLSYVFLKNDKIYHTKNMQEEAIIPCSTADAMLSSKVFIGYFGLNLFEAMLCGCHIITVNPSSYHSKLTELITDNLPVHNYGLTIDQNEKKLENMIMRLLNSSEKRTRTAQQALQKVINSHEKCVNFIKECLD